MQRILLGRAGEDRAVSFLKSLGYEVMTRNYKCKSGEIDIVARDGGVIAFVEVKTRRSDEFGTPGASVNRRKQRRISMAAVSYLQRNNLLDSPARFDVVEISLSGGKERINIIKNAFDQAQ